MQAIETHAFLSLFALFLSVVAAALLARPAWSVDLSATSVFYGEDPTVIRSLARQQTFTRLGLLLLALAVGLQGWVIATQGPGPRQVGDAGLKTWSAAALAGIVAWIVAHRLASWRAEAAASRLHQILGSRRSTSEAAR
jgi:hypothetical protein